MNNKVVLVTGSSKGIGAACIKTFASNNYNVVINYNSSKEQAYKLEKEIQKYNIDSLVIKCDISSEEEVKKMIEKIIEKFGRLDILVNNAAIEINTEFEDKNVEDFKKVLGVNLIGSFLVSKYAAKYMIKNNFGKIINITSNNGINKYDPTTLEYDASKAGLISLTHNLAVKYAPIINVNAVAPGWIETNKIKDIDNSLDNLFIKEESKTIFKNRFGQEQEVADLVFFLLVQKF